MSSPDPISLPMSDQVDDIEHLSESDNNVKQETKYPSAPVTTPSRSFNYDSLFEDEDDIKPFGTTLRVESPFYRHNQHGNQVKSEQDLEHLDAGWENKDDEQIDASSGRSSALGRSQLTYRSGRRRAACLVQGKQPDSG